MEEKSHFLLLFIAVQFAVDKLPSHLERVRGDLQRRALATAAFGGAPLPLAGWFLLGHFIFLFGARLVCFGRFTAGSCE